MAPLDIVPHLQAHVIGIETAAGKWPHDLIVAHQEFEVEVLRQVEAVEDLAVPVAGPALVHNLGFDLRDEVLRLLMGDGEQIPLPLAQIGIVVADEQEEVFLR